MPNFNESTPLSVPRALPLGVGEATSETPAFTTQAAGVAILLPLGAGLLAFVGVGLLCIALDMPARVAIGTAGAAVLLVGMYWMLDAKSIMFRVETVTGQDATNRDGQIGTPPPRVLVEVSEPEQGRWQLLDLPGTPEQLTQLARGLALGRPFAESEWCGANRPYSKADFRLLRSTLLERGVLEWRNPDAPAQGVKMTVVGRAVFKRLGEPAHARATEPGGILLTQGEQQGGDDA